MQQNFGWKGIRRKPPANPDQEECVRQIVESRMLADGNAEFWVRKILREQVGFVNIEEIAHVVLDLEIMRDLTRRRTPKFKVRQ